MTDWLIDCLVECCSCIQSSGCTFTRYSQRVDNVSATRGCTGNASGDGTKTHLHRARARHSD